MEAVVAVLPELAAILIVEAEAEASRGGLMRASTITELTGFALLADAGWLVLPALGFALAGQFLLLVGYVMDDETAAASLRRLVEPVTRRYRRSAEEGLPNAA